MASLPFDSLPESLGFTGTSCVAGYSLAIVTHDRNMGCGQGRRIVSPRAGPWCNGRQQACQTMFSRSQGKNNNACFLDTIITAR
jgi:hypothetical protein